MSRIPPPILRSYLLDGYLSSRHCLRPSYTLYARPSLYDRHHGPRAVQKRVAGEHGRHPAGESRRSYSVEVREHKRHVEGREDLSSETYQDWELTVGIEIHAQLNTARKLFSAAPSTVNAEPNTSVSYFDLAMPGSLPIFQKETLIPAIRAALALNCEIQKESRFDRKHYFHWDQPAGYQITQYYKPFAKDGYVMLYPQDGIAEEDGSEVRVGIKQVQMEQDTAKSIAQLHGEQLLDFNRAGIPLIEIITLPQIHYPSTAAALVRKIQILLSSVDACVLGMESGGLRADVNVSVKKKGSDGALGYGGITGLGQRTEIKNLSSFKSVRDAIVAERNRQIALLEAGGVVEGETRGWTIGSTETTRLRGKEGEVDYRYMPDADIAPVYIGDDLVSHLKNSLGVLPDDELNELVEKYDLTMKDAMSLVALDEGGRIEYFYNVFDELTELGLYPDDSKRLGKICGNWVLHELGGISKDTTIPGAEVEIDSDGNCTIPASKLAQIIYYLENQKITGQTAKIVLSKVFDLESQGKGVSVDQIIEDGNMWFQSMSDEEYLTLARSVAQENVLEQISKGQKGKIMFLVGQMIRTGEKGRVEPLRAQEAIKKIVEEYEAGKQGQ